MAKAAALLRAYLIVGSDHLKRDTAVTKLKGYVREGLEDFNIDERTAASSADPSELVSSLQTLPFGGGIRIVIIHDAEKLPKPSSEAIVSYLADPNPSTVLCLVAESLASSTRLYKAVAKQGKSAVIRCAPLKPWKVPEFAQTLASARGLRLPMDAARELVSRVGTSTTMLDNQIQTLAGLVAPATTITLDDVVFHVARTAEASNWDVANALCERNVENALRLYRTIKKPDLVSLNSIIAMRVRELICAKSLVERGGPFSLEEELGRKDWQVKNHVRWASGFSAQELVDLLKGAAELDRALKGSQDSESAFVRYVCSFARQA